MTSRFQKGRPSHNYVGTGARLAAAFVFCVGGVVGCARSDQSLHVETAQPSEPPADLASGFGQAAAAGSDLVVLGDTWSPKADSYQPFIRSVDGEWSLLPTLPLSGVFRIASAGETVVLGGVACSEPKCQSGQLAFLMLSADRFSWEELPSRDVKLSTETEMTTARSPQTYAYFEIGSSAYFVGPDGDVNEVPAGAQIESQGSFRCVAVDTIVSVPYAAEPMPGTQGGPLQLQTLVGEVMSFSFSDPDAGWTSAGAVPEGVATSGGDLCEPDGLTIVGSGTESHYSVSTRRWTSGPSNFEDVVGNQIAFNTPGILASADSSTVFMATWDERLISRVGRGEWVDTGIAATWVYATKKSVLSFSPEVDKDVQVVWPR